MNTDKRTVVNTSFGNILFKFRIKNSMTLQDLANALDYSKGYVNKLENGKMTPSENTCEYIENCLQISGLKKARLDDIKMSYTKQKNQKVLSNKDCRLADKLKDYRFFNNVSQTAMANNLGISRITYIRLEKSEKRFTEKEYFSIAKKFKIKDAEESFKTDRVNGFIRNECRLMDLLDKYLNKNFMTLSSFAEKFNLDYARLGHLRRNNYKIKEAEYWEIAEILELKNIYYMIGYDTKNGFVEG